MKCECTTAENITEAASQEPGWHTRKEQIKYGFQSDGQYIWAAIMRGVCVGVGCEAGKFSGQKTKSSECDAILALSTIAVVRQL